MSVPGRGGVSRRAAGIVALAGFLAAAASAADGAPAGWKLIKDRKGNCQMQVPSAWKGDVSAASPEDHQAMASIHLMPGKNWDESRLMAQQVMPPTTMLEDTADRLWFAYGTNPAETTWYVAVPGPLGPCAAQVTFKNEALADTAKQIAASVAASPATP